MNNNVFLRVFVPVLLLSGIVTMGYSQDSLKRAPEKKPVVTVVKPAAVKQGAIPINPKTGRPYSKYGYGAYAKTYRQQQIADSIKKAGVPPIKVATTNIATTPPPVKPDTTLATAPVKVDKSLNGQYQYLLTKVYNYQKPFVDAMWKNFNDTLKNARTQLKAANEKITAQNTTISGLQTDVNNKDLSLAKTDVMNVVGISLPKTTYNIIMWGLVIVIGVIAAVVIFQSGGYRKEASYRTTLYNELEEEFKTFKAKANDKEKKLARELQTERNKVDELMGRG